MKKKYSRKRVALKKAIQSVAGRDDVENFEKVLNQNKFLFRLDEYTGPRITTTNTSASNIVSQPSYEEDNSPPSVHSAIDVNDEDDDDDEENLPPQPIAPVTMNKI